MKVLWKALNGKEYTIVGKNIDEIYEKIADLREDLGIAKPDVMVAQTEDKSILASSKNKLLEMEDLDEELQQQVREGLEESHNNIDMKKMN